MIDYTPLYRTLQDTPLSVWGETLPPQVDAALQPSVHRDLPGWLDTLRHLPDIRPSQVDLSAACIQVGTAADCTAEQQQTLKSLLQQLKPWRKGPFDLFGIHIDTEWRSDLKWNRLKDHIQPLADRLVLDVGCGSGYHCWRMAGAGAKLTIGLEPGLLSVVQFHALQHFIGHRGVHVVPLPLEALPDKVHGFDTVFSMGVLHHRRSPFDHLFKLRSLLRAGGELVLETLVIEGGPGQVMVPEGRYAKMRNVWFLPSTATLASWLKRSGFRNVRLVDVTRTTSEEQRKTDWMTYESLTDFLDPNNPARTVEGLPAPTRAIFLAERP